MKKGIFVLFLAIFSLFIVGCTKREKMFDKGDFKIVLTEDYKEDIYKDINYYFMSNNSSVAVLKEDFELLKKVNLTSESTLEDYAKAVLRANNKEAIIIAEENFSYFTYNKTINTVKFFYLAAVKKGNDGFWLINFMCLDEDKDKLKDEFLKYARTIEV